MELLLHKTALTGNIYKQRDTGQQNVAFSGAKQNKSVSRFRKPEKNREETEMITKKYNNFDNMKIVFIIC